MSKWQLTLIQCGKKLRKFGGTKHDVKWEADYMISCIQTLGDNEMNYKKVIEDFNNGTIDATKWQLVISTNFGLQSNLHD
jgi:hypothetical protein